MKQPLIILTGPTAVGKTALSLALAKSVGGEIISADSMQVYRHMDIGSAKVTAAVMGEIPHHLIDILEPTEEFNVMIFQQMAKQALTKIYANNHIPIIVGGTGFYIQALLYDIEFEKNADCGHIRMELETLSKKLGAENMHRLLQEIDPPSAAVIHVNNQKRVIRAIEYYRQTGEKISDHNEEQKKKQSPYNFFYYVINTDRATLYERIEQRVDQMIASGLVEEVKKLADLGCTRDMVSMQGLGYKEILDYLNGTCSLEDAVYILKRDTRHFAKRQITWFKREPDVRWLNLPDFHSDLNQVLFKILQDTKEMGNQENETNGNQSYV